MNTKSAVTIIGILLLVGVGVFLFGGNDANAPTNPDSDVQSAQTELSSDIEDGNYVIQAEESSVRWTARKSLVNGYEDTGTIPVASSSINVQDGEIATATVEFDMTGIAVQQTSNTSAGVDQLTEHLQSQDFFAVEEHPTSTLTVLSTEPIASTTAETDHTVTANLTLKGQTNEVTFPAEIGTQENTLIVRGNMTIDRTRWGIRYGSDSFFDNLGDNVIADTVDIAVNLQAPQRSTTISDEVSTTTTNN